MTADTTDAAYGATLTIDLDALVSNWRFLGRRAGTEAGAVVKADAYGIGIEPAVTALNRAGCRNFFVAHLSEGIRARKAAPEATVYILNGLLPGSSGIYAEHGLSPVLGSHEELLEWASFRQTGAQVRSAALHVDTAMNRLGLWPGEGLNLARERSGVIAAAGIGLLMSHFASSEDETDPANARQIAAFAEKHKLKQITVADLIAYRQAREKLVERVHSFPVKTEFGEMTGHVYVTRFDDTQHFAFVMGKLGDGEKVPARLHRANVVADVLGGASSIQCALRRFQKEGRGVLVYLRDGSAGVPIKSVEEGSDAVRFQQWREIGLGAQILRDLGVASIVNLASTSRSFVGLSGFGIEIAETEPLE